MQITVTVSDDLVAEAEACGLAPEAYVERLVSERLPVAKPLSSPEERLAQLDRLFETLAANGEKSPILPPEAFTRESFYQDHD